MIFKKKVMMTLSISADSKESAKECAKSLVELFRENSVSGAGIMKSGNIEEYDGKVQSIKFIKDTQEAH